MHQLPREKQNKKKNTSIIEKVINRRIQIQLKKAARTRISKKLIKPFLEPAYLEAEVIGEPNWSQTQKKDAHHKVANSIPGARKAYLYKSNPGKREGH